jgi:hypothetical protein
MLVSIDYIDYKYIGFLSRLKIAASKELLSPFDLLLVKRTLVNANLLAKMNHSISLSSCSSLSKATELAGKGSSVRGDFGLVRWRRRLLSVFVTDRGIAGYLNIRWAMHALMLMALSSSLTLGGAWRFGDRPAHVDIYPIYRPPELIGKSGRLTNDMGLDLWMLGCTVSWSTYLAGIEELTLIRFSESLLGDHYLMKRETIICECKLTQLLIMIKQNLGKSYIREYQRMLPRLLRTTADNWRGL